MNTFAKRIKLLRLERKFTQKYLAKQLGIIPTAYQRYEYGTREPDLDTLCNISKFFNVTTDWLLGLSNKQDINVHLNLQKNNNVVELTNNL